MSLNKSNQSLKQINMILNKSNKSLNQQHEPEPEKQSEVLSNGVPPDLYHADGTPNYGKAALYIESLRLNHPSYVQAAKYI